MKDYTDYYAVVINHRLYDADGASYELSRLIDTYRYYRYANEYAPDDGRYIEHVVNVAKNWADDCKARAIDNAFHLLRKSDHSDVDKDAKLLDTLEGLVTDATDPVGLSIQQKISLLRVFEAEFDDRKTPIDIVPTDGDVIDRLNNDGEAYGVSKERWLEFDSGLEDRLKSDD